MTKARDSELSWEKLNAPKEMIRIPNEILISKRKSSIDRHIREPPVPLTLGL